MRQKEKGRGKICFPFSTSAVKPHPAFTVSVTLLCVFLMRPPLTLKRLHSWYLTLTDWLAFLSNTLTCIHSLSTIHFPTHKTFSLSLFLSPLLPTLVTSLPLSHTYTRHTTKRHRSICGVRREGNPFCSAMCYKLSFHHFFPLTLNDSKRNFSLLFFSRLHHISMNNKNVHSSTTLKRQVNSLKPPTNQIQDTKLGQIPRDSNSTLDLSFGDFFGDSHGKLLSSPSDKRHLWWQTKVRMSLDKAGCVCNLYMCLFE